MDGAQEVGARRCNELLAYFGKNGMPGTLLEGENIFYLCADGDYLEDQNFFVEVCGDTHVLVTARVVLSSESLPRAKLLETCNHINEKFNWMKAVIGDEECTSVLFVLQIPTLVTEWEDLSFSLTEVFMRYVDDASGILAEVMLA